MPYIHCPCTGWCITYPVQPGEFHHRDCKKWNRQHKGAEVFQTRTELIVTGDPGEDENHNCDAMGCTSVSHVLFRFPLPHGVNACPAPDLQLLARQCGAFSGNGAEVGFTEEAWARFTAALGVSASGHQTFSQQPPTTRGEG